MTDTEIDTTNKFLVMSKGRDLIIASPPHSLISADDALVFAAYLVLMAEYCHPSHTFEQVKDAVASA